jgi:predicted nucleic acid-binding protein
MRILLDTNILTRLIEPTHSMHLDARDATRALAIQGHNLCIVPQNLYELWVVCTRPTANKGLGKSTAEAGTELANLKSLFTLLDDTPALFPMWEQLVTANSVVGKVAHDARLVAAMMVHGIDHILTFNHADFQRFANIAVLTPSAVLVTTTVAVVPPKQTPP